jgi:hypothetical protein
MVTPRRERPRPPWLRRPTALPRGPRLYTFDPLDAVRSQFTTPPAGFLRATTSASEWMMYLALAKILGAPAEPTEPPFIGAPGVWIYQEPTMGGRNQAGGAVIDFIVLAGTRTSENTLLRLQTERYHYFANAFKQYTDETQLMRLFAIARVLDISENDILGDPTGAKACRHLAESLAGYAMPNPLASSRQRRFSGWRPSRQ